MLTLRDDPENVKICELINKKKKIPIFWYPKERSEYRNSVENLESFNTEKFRDRFELSKDQSSNIFTGLKKDCVFEKNQSKFFKFSMFS